MAELLLYLFEDDKFKVISFYINKTAADIALHSPLIDFLDGNLLGSPRNGFEFCADIRNCAETADLL